MDRGSSKAGHGTAACLGAVSHALGGNSKQAPSGQSNIEGRAPTGQSRGASLQPASRVFKTLIVCDTGPRSNITWPCVFRIRFGDKRADWASCRRDTQLGRQATGDYDSSLPS